MFCIWLFGETTLPFNKILRLFQDCELSESLILRFPDQHPTHTHTDTANTKQHHFHTSYHGSTNLKSINPDFKRFFHVSRCSSQFKPCHFCLVRSCKSSKHWNLKQKRNDETCDDQHFLYQQIHMLCTAYSRRVFFRRLPTEKKKQFFFGFFMFEPATRIPNLTSDSDFVHLKHPEKHIKSQISSCRRFILIFGPILAAKVWEFS